MTDVQASIGLVQLRKLKSIIKERKQIANFFQKNLCDVEWLTLPKSQKAIQFMASLRNNSQL